MNFSLIYESVFANTSWCVFLNPEDFVPGCSRLSVPMCLCFCVSSPKGIGRLCRRQRYVAGGEHTDISAGTSHFPNAKIQCLSL